MLLPSPAQLRDGFTMADKNDPNLPEGVRLVCRDGRDPIELTIRAADGDQLAWRIHDLIPLIQSGGLNRLIASAKQSGKPTG